MVRNTFQFSILLALWVGCTANDCCLPVDLENIAGEYLVYEYGYSPGDKYITVVVPSDPAQLLNFTAAGDFSSNYQGLDSFRFYQVYDHPTQGKVLALYEQEPPSANPVNLDQLAHSYIMQVDGITLKLMYRYCFEGCHIGLQKIK